MPKTAEQKKVFREYQRDWNDRWKAAAHAILGSVCVRCGFSDSRALQIDHVNGDGTRELKEGRQLKWGRGSYYRKVVQEVASGKYQLLCANCNWIKRHENGEHMARMV